MTELTDFTTIIAVLGVLAFLVSVITQVTKEMWFLDKIPTALQVTVLSVVLTVVAYFAYISYNQIQMQWYFVVGAIIGGFLVAFVSMFGWKKLSELFTRFKKK